MYHFLKVLDFLSNQRLQSFQPSVSIEDTAPACLYGEGYFNERMLVSGTRAFTGCAVLHSRIVDDNLRLMHAIVGTLVATIPRFQVQSLCADWKIEP